MNIFLIIYVVSIILIIVHNGYQCTENMSKGNQLSKSDLIIFIVTFIPLLNSIVVLFIVGMYIKIYEIKKQTK